MFAKQQQGPRSRVSGGVPSTVPDCRLPMAGRGNTLQTRQPADRSPNHWTLRTSLAAGYPKKTAGANPKAHLAWVHNLLCLRLPFSPLPHSSYSPPLLFPNVSLKTAQFAALFLFFWTFPNPGALRTQEYCLCLFVVCGHHGGRRCWTSVA